MPPSPLKFHPSPCFYSKPTSGSSSETNLIMDDVHMRDVERTNVRQVAHMDDRTNRRESMVNNFQHALPYLSLATEQLRNYYPDRANEVAKITHSMTSIFGSAVLDLNTDWDILRRDFNTVNIQNKSSRLEHNDMLNPVSNNCLLLPPGLSVQMSTAENHQMIQDASTSSSNSPPAPIGTGRPTGGENFHSPERAPGNGYGFPTWARIAASTVPFSSSAPSAGQLMAVDVARAEGLRMIWVNGCRPTTTLRQLTGKIHTGPLLSIAFDNDHLSACVIFHLAESARALVDENDLFQKTHGGVSLFGRGFELQFGSFYPTDDWIMCMSDSGGRERRRLTFARSSLFHDVTPREFEKDVFEVAGGAEHVELIWLFNNGNATVVCNSVPIARKVLDHFRKLARAKNGVYVGLGVSYSTDPCEKELRLTTTLGSTMGMTSWQHFFNKKRR